jgi:hypothetical protein
MVNSVIVKYCQIVYNPFLLNKFMDEKKQNELDKQIEAENSDVSCSSCPIDSVAQKIMSLFRRK